MSDEKQPQSGEQVFVKTSLNTWTSMSRSEANRGSYYIICSSTDEEWAQKVESVLVDVHLTNST